MSRGADDLTESEQARRVATALSSSASSFAPRFPAIARILGSAAEELRWEARARPEGAPRDLVLDAISEGNQTVSDLVEASGLSEWRTRQALRELEAAGRVGSRKAGAALVYVLI